jgi:hypothetical protein
MFHVVILPDHRFVGESVREESPSDADPQEGSFRTVCVGVQQVLEMASISHQVLWSVVDRVFEHTVSFELASRE